MKSKAYRLALGAVISAAILFATASSHYSLAAQKPAAAPKASGIKMTRMYCGPDGLSHFEDVNMKTDAANRTEAMKAATVAFGKGMPGSFTDWHPEPQRQYVISLKGQLELEVGNGVKRTFGPGDILLAEDLTCKGHTSRTVGTTERISIIVPLAPAAK